MTIGSMTPILDLDLKDYALRLDIYASSRWNIQREEIATRVDQIYFKTVNFDYVSNDITLNCDVFPEGETEILSSQTSLNFLRQILNLQKHHTVEIEIQPDQFIYADIDRPASREEKLEKAIHFLSYAPDVNFNGDFSNFYDQVKASGSCGIPQEDAGLILALLISLYRPEKKYDIGFLRPIFYDNGLSPLWLTDAGYKLSTPYGVEPDNEIPLKLLDGAYMHLMEMAEIRAESPEGEIRGKAISDSIKAIGQSVKEYADKLKSLVEKESFSVTVYEKERLSIMIARCEKASENLDEATKKSVRAACAALCDKIGQGSSSCVTT